MKTKRKFVEGESPRMEPRRVAAIELPEDVYMDDEETVDPNDVATLRAALAASNAALEEERRWRTEQEMAATEALDQVRSRSIVLQQRSRTAVQEHSSTVAL